jgi:hypothetical protein
VVDQLVERGGRYLEVVAKGGMALHHQGARGGQVGRP